MGTTKQNKYKKQEETDNNFAASRLKRRSVSRFFFVWTPLLRYSLAASTWSCLSDLNKFRLALLTSPKLPQNLQEEKRNYYRCKPGWRMERTCQKTLQKSRETRIIED